MRRFPHLRRVTAVFTHLLLLQLAFASAAGACPLGEGGNSHAGIQMNGAPSPGDQHHPAHAAVTAAHPLALPASHHDGGGHCDMSCATPCVTAGHCMANAVLDRADAHDAFARDGSGVSVHGAAAPHSVSTAPEPPPPRA